MKKMHAVNKARNPSASDISRKRSEYADPSGGCPPTDNEIQLRAYWIHLDRGGQHGYDLDDWLQAERELLDELRRPDSSAEVSVE